MRDGGGKKGRRGGTALQPRRRGGVPARPLGRREQRPEAAAAAELGGRARHRRCAASEAGGGGGGRASQGECAPARGRRHGNGGAPRAAACGAGGSGRAPGGDRYCPPACLAPPLTGDGDRRRPVRAVVLGLSRPVPGTRAGHRRGEGVRGVCPGQRSERGWEGAQDGTKA